MKFDNSYKYKRKVIFLNVVRWGSLIALFWIVLFAVMAFLDVPLALAAIIPLIVIFAIGLAIAAAMFYIEKETENIEGDCAFKSYVKKIILGAMTHE